MKISGLKDCWQILKIAGSGFGKHNGLKLSASLSFFTILTIGPMMLIIIFISNLFWGRSAVEGTIFKEISGVVGEGAAIQIEELIKNATVASSNFIAVISFVALFLAATTVFTQLQISMNIVWNLQVKNRRNWKQMLKNRLLSFSIVSGLALLLIVFLILNGLLDGFANIIEDIFPQISFSVIYIINLTLTLIIVAFLFAFIFKVLPDAHIKWKHVKAGALFTALLFMIGRFVLTFYINQSDMSTSYGSAGSLTVLLLWIYLSAIIFFFGAEVTKAYALKYGDEIKPKDYAVTIKVVQSESNERSIQDNEKS